VLSTFFGIANDCLRNGELTEESAPVLFNLDEIGNIHIPDLPAALGVGRGRRMTYALGYQNIAQLYHQYGTDGGDAVLGSVGAMVFLPGVDQRTAEYASRRLGTTTVLLSSSVDVREGDRFDSERTTEVGRPLMDATEIRQMTKYKQAIAIISNAPPVRLTYPKFAKIENPPLSEREKRFQRADDPTLPIMSPLPEFTEPPITQVSASQGKEPKSDRTQREQSFKSAQNRWDQATRAVKGDSTQLLGFEQEYDLISVDEDRMPLFDLGSRDW
jgi:type IV secretory pathway TraG/TraD family ATPase VirD4